MSPSTSYFSAVVFRKIRGSDLWKGPRHSTNRGPPTKPFQFYFSLMIDTNETTIVSCPALLIIVLVRPNLS